MFIKLAGILLLVLIVLFLIHYFMKTHNLLNNKKEGFVSNQCPTNLIKKGNQIFLYNPKLAKVPGVNPIVFKNLRDYEHFIKWQRGSGLNCPILHLERMYDSQGFEKYEIKSSFMLDNPTGPLNHNLPVINKPPSLEKLLNANEENKPYNQNSIPAYDQNNQNIGRFTKLDNMTIINP